MSDRSRKNSPVPRPCQWTDTALLEISDLSLSFTRDPARGDVAPRPSRTSLARWRCRASASAPEPRPRIFPSLPTRPASAAGRCRGSSDRGEGNVGPTRLKGARRSLSMTGLAPRKAERTTARLNRSMCPIWTMSPFVRAARGARPLFKIVVIGFSMKTCFPLSMAALAPGKWAEVGTTITRASESARDIVSEACALTPALLDFRRALGPRLRESAEPDSRQIAQNSIWWNPRLPAPIHRRVGWLANHHSSRARL